MAENTKQTGFVSQGQSSGKGGGTFATPSGDPAEQKMSELINKSIQKYDTELKKYLEKEYLTGEKPHQTILDTVTEYNAGYGFIDRKLTDTPTDALAVVNRKFVTLNGATASRPSGPVTGQFYFNTSTSKPEWYTGSAWTTPSVMVTA